MSLDQTDLNKFSNGDGQSAVSRKLGQKMGMGRGVFSATGGSTIAAHGTGLIIPKGATITRVVYKVLTTFTSLTDAATIALHCVAAGDIKAAIAISNAANAWDAAIPAITTPVTATAASWLHTTADSEITATVAVEDLTAGKLVLFAEWFYWGDLSLT